jgi:hypothetical protein
VLWVTPKFSRSQVDRAGAVLVSKPISEPTLGAALDVVSNWRSSHSFPMNTFQITLRRKAQHIYPSALVAQRLKRLSSIELKLRRFQTMKLSQMQDIGGCRAVLRTSSEVRLLRDTYRKSDLKHVFAREDDYISTPKKSGYRGIHLIYRYRSDRASTYTGLQIELQFRSRIQHAWATAVETVGTFLQQSLKSSEGSEKWLRFFALSSSVFAVGEGTTPIPETPARKTILLHETRRLMQELRVRHALESYGNALKRLETGKTNAKYFLLQLSPIDGFLKVTGFGAAELERATSSYLEAEKALDERRAEQAVLVSAESIDSLRRAYPNYFLDTRVFLMELQSAMRR